MAWLLATADTWVEAGCCRPLPLVRSWCRRHSLAKSFADKTTSMQVQKLEIEAGSHPQRDSPALPLRLTHEGRYLGASPPTGSAGDGFSVVRGGGDAGSGAAR